LIPLKKPKASAINPELLSTEGSKDFEQKETKLAKVRHLPLEKLRSQLRSEPEEVNVQAVW
jgi:hypothetical protein